MIARALILYVDVYDILPSNRMFRITLFYEYMHKSQHFVPAIGQTRCVP